MSITKDTMSITKVQRIMKGQHKSEDLRNGPYNQVEPAFSSGGGGGEPLAECGNCGRRFNTNALQRHQPICMKTSQKARKVFDSGKQRAEGTDIKSVNKGLARGGRGGTQSRGGRQTTIGARQEPNKTAAIKAAENKKHNWRQKHEEFVRTIRAAKGYQHAKDTGGALPPPPPPAANPDYIQCDYCGRRFNESAAERHINFCKEQKSRLPGKKPDAAASAKWSATRNYKAPKLKPKTVSQGSGYGRSPTSTMNGSSPKSTLVGANTGGRAATNGGRMYQASQYEDDLGGTSNQSGRALRTGRTAETYSEARELSAKQRGSMPRKGPQGDIRNKAGYKLRQLQYSPSSDYSDEGDSRYGGNNSSGYSSSGMSGDSMRAGSAAKFCHNCGTRYPVAAAKFCCECGLKRMSVQ